MTRTSHLFRFSLVGALGIGVQLGVLATLVALRVSYLVATALAVESAVLHNFLWHQHFTWVDRAGSDGQAVLGRLLRFHLSNGLISLAGNLLLMRWLVGEFQIPVIPANIVTISICFAANFLSSDRWVFLALAERPLPHQHQRALGKGNINERSRDT
jgi:putative flippase GtrA